jgi:hypothetical protein
MNAHGMGMPMLLLLFAAGIVVYGLSKLRPR